MKKTESLMLLFYVLMVLGCASSQEPKLIGKWICKATSDRMELSESHSCSMDSMGFRYSGKWTLSKSEIKIETEQIALKGIFDGKNIVVEDAIMHNKYVFEKIGETKS